MSTLNSFSAEMDNLKKTISHDHIYQMIDLVELFEETLDEDEYDYEMDIMKYTIKVLDAQLITIKDAEDIIWWYIETIEDTKHKQNEWVQFKTDILISLESYEYEDEDEHEYEYEYEYEHDSGEEYECESWDCLDM